MAFQFNHSDRIAMSDIIERFEKLRDERQDYEELGEDYLIDNPDDEPLAPWEEAHSDEAQELTLLSELMTDLCGEGGDEQFEGEWYPSDLIRESDFVDHVKELLNDCEIIPSEIPWYVVIDWQATADHVRVDYSSVEIQGVTYWYR